MSETLFSEIEIEKRYKLLGGIFLKPYPVKAFSLFKPGRIVSLAAVASCFADSSTARKLKKL